VQLKVNFNSNLKRKAPKKLRFYRFRIFLLKGPSILTSDCAEKNIHKSPAAKKTYFTVLRFPEDKKLFEITRLVHIYKQTRISGALVHSRKSD
jgi:hypothetical protein